MAIEDENQKGAFAFVVEACLEWEMLTIEIFYIIDRLFSVTKSIEKIVRFLFSLSSF